jgi:uncharacterized protein YcfJ
MKKTVLFSAIGALSALSSAAGAQEFGRVISSTPVTQQVAVPRQVCTNQPVAVQQPNTGAGGVIGGLAGGVIGNQIGGGSGRAAATVLGVVGGALLGNRIESNGNAPQVQNFQQCSTQTSYENRTVAYNVTYEYAGRQYTVQMPNDPGPTIPLQVTPVGGAPAGAGYDAAPGGVVMAPPVTQAVGQPIAQIVTVPPPVYAAPYPVYAAPYPVYGSPYYYPPIGLSLGFGFFGGGGHHHWR